MPDLASHRDQDQFTITAVSHLLQTRDRDGLVPFFEQTRSGKPFETAFAQAFGATPAEFEAEYRAEVERLRADR
ncbi:MAG: hypothetical protein K0R39_1651 [Symbiobacteriaceae bacterium]|nr:hypothetical protein [Symbiobacteriaceae bacterium]